VFDIVPCGFSLLQTVIPSVEYESTGDSDGVRRRLRALAFQAQSAPLQSATTDGDSSLYATLTADRDDCPDNLVSSFVDGSKSTWRCLANRSHTTLRKRLRMRDGRQCIFTGDRERVEVAHLMKPMHPFWNLVHITCTRAHLSQLPASLLQKVTGLFDPCVAASVCHGLLGYYADPGSIAFRVVSYSSHSVDVLPVLTNCWDSSSKTWSDPASPLRFLLSPATASTSATCTAFSKGACYLVLQQPNNYTVSPSRQISRSASRLAQDQQRQANQNRRRTTSRSTPGRSTSTLSSASELESCGSTAVIRRRRSPGSRHSTGTTKHTCTPRPIDGTLTRSPELERRRARLSGVWPARRLTRHLPSLAKASPSTDVGGSAEMHSVER
jgi:hypothetical protein